MRVPDSIAQPFLEEVAEHCEDAQSYHETTKLNRVNIIRLGTRIESIVNNPPIYRQGMRPWQNYSARDTVTLPKPTLGRMTVAQVIRAPRSHSGSYSELPLHLGQLATIRSASYGPTAYAPFP